MLQPLYDCKLQNLALYYRYLIYQLNVPVNNVNYNQTKDLSLDVVVVVNWSASSPSTQAIWVRFPLSHNFYYAKVAWKERK